MAAAYSKGVLQEVLDEFEVPLEEQIRIGEKLRRWWMDRVLPTEPLRCHWCEQRAAKYTVTIERIGEPGGDPRRGFVRLESVALCEECIRDVRFSNDTARVYDVKSHQRPGAI